MWRGNFPCLWVPICFRCARIIESSSETVTVADDVVQIAQEDVVVEQAPLVEANETGAEQIVSNENLKVVSEPVIPLVDLADPGNTAIDLAMEQVVEQVIENELENYTSAD